MRCGALVSRMNGIIFNPNDTCLRSFVALMQRNKAAHVVCP